METDKQKNVKMKDWMYLEQAVATSRLLFKLAGLVVNQFYLSLGWDPGKSFFMSFHLLSYKSENGEASLKRFLPRIKQEDIENDFLVTDKINQFWFSSLFFLFYWGKLIFIYFDFQNLLF